MEFCQSEKVGTPGYAMTRNQAFPVEFSRNIQSWHCCIA